MNLCRALSCCLSALLLGAAPQVGQADRLNPLISDHPSPYVRGAARQPVDWRPFGPEAFAEARQLGRPILLDIGAVWCHWCHVMDRETYGDLKVARIINRLLVPVKVDRDARPDIDRRYQKFARALSGVSGWPLTAFLTPGGHVIYITTFVPSRDGEGHMGMISLVRKVAKIYGEKGEEVARVARDSTKEIGRYTPKGSRRRALGPALVAGIRAGIMREFDPAVALMAGPPARFPRAAAIEFLFEKDTSPEMRAAALERLRIIARSGLRDHLGGGFHRYTTDAAWRVPHFEKMSFVQAAMIRAFSRAYALAEEEGFREAAIETVSFLDREGSDRVRGGFYSSQDAGDGSYFTWEVSEVRRLLAPAEARAAIAHFGLKEKANQIHGRPEENVLFLERPTSSEAQITPILTSAKRKLQAARRERRPPSWDRSLYVGWNGMLASAYFDAARYLGCMSCRAFAMKTAERILKKALDPNQGIAHEMPPRRLARRRSLEDHAWAATVLLDAFEETGEERYREGARVALAVTRRFLWDGERGGFTDDRPESWLEGIHFGTRTMKDIDGPSAQATVAEALHRLSSVTGEKKYLEWGRVHLESGIGEIASLGALHGALGRAVELYVEGAVTVVLVGEKKASRKLRRRALSTFRPRRIVLTVPEGAPARGLPEAVQAMIKEYEAGTFGKSPAVAFVCAGKVCAFPTADPSEMAKLIATFGRREGHPGAGWRAP